MDNMSASKDIDYGPLAELIGVWQGSKGLDVAPEPDGVEKNPYYETITFSAIGDVTNAETQTLAALHYRQIVQRQSNGKLLHDQTGYWMWDADAQIVIHSLSIPRAVTVIAGGKHSGKRTDDGNFLLEVSAAINDKDWQVIQSPFMRDNAKTTGFSQKVVVGNGQLVYSQVTVVDIYGKVFEHTEQNQLIRQ